MTSWGLTSLFLEPTLITSTSIRSAMANPRKWNRGRVAQAIGYVSSESRRSVELNVDDDGGPRWQSSTLWRTAWARASIRGWWCCRSKTTSRHVHASACTDRLNGKSAILTVVYVFCGIIVLMDTCYKFQYIIVDIFVCYKNAKLICNQMDTKCIIAWFVKRLYRWDVRLIKNAKLICNHTDTKCIVAWFEKRSFQCYRVSIRVAFITKN